MTRDSELVTRLGLPEPLRATMYTASNGELAWPLESAAEAVNWIASKGLAILGGEAWHVDEAGRIMAIIPLIGSTIPAVRGWSVDDRRSGELWPDFVARSLQSALRALDREAAAMTEEVPTILRAQLRYNLTFASEQQYAELI